MLCYKIAQSPEGQVPTYCSKRKEEMGKEMPRTVAKQLLTETAETVLTRRYYLKDGQGNVLENWESLCPGSGRGSRA
ncbi:hypothetical protein VU06_04980 [Desulfobulbus sp. F3]|nr:hypothetical protein [Desulfobulbus sp. F3]